MQEKLENYFSTFLISIFYGLPFFVALLSKFENDNSISQNGKKILPQNHLKKYV